MHLQIIEPYLGGHHTNYLEALIPAFNRCLNDGVLTRVTITITNAHFNHLQKAALNLKTLSPKIVFDSSFLEISPAPNLRDRIHLFRAMNRAVKEVQPDHLIVPSADYDVMVQAILNRFVRFGKGTAINATGIIHYGMPKSLTNGLKESFKQYVYETAWRYSRWDTLMLVNPLMYEGLSDKAKMNKVLKVLPDPVDATVKESATDARQYFELPKENVLLGAVGYMDNRKAIPQLLVAFSQSLAMGHNATLVLLGELARPYEQLIDAEYQSLIDSGRLIVVNRFLTQKEVQLAYAAMDVVSILQYRRANLSANLLKAMMYDKPIIADQFGYTGMMLSRFKLGYACSVDNVDSVKSSIIKAIKEAKDYQPAKQTKRLKQFHSTENFANTLLQSVVGNQKDLPVKTWEWVCESVAN